MQMTFSGGLGIWRLSEILPRDFGLSQRREHCLTCLGQWTHTIILDTVQVTCLAGIRGNVDEPSAGPANFQISRLHYDVVAVYTHRCRVPNFKPTFRMRASGNRGKNHNALGESDDWTGVYSLCEAADVVQRNDIGLSIHYYPSLQYEDVLELKVFPFRHYNFEHIQYTHHISTKTCKTGTPIIWNHFDLTQSFF